MTQFVQQWKEQVKRLKRELYALYLAYRDPRAPFYARVVAISVVGYAFSPIDLIPDFIPILGYLDDLILLPLGIALAIRLTPPAVMVESREKAALLIDQQKPVNRIAAFVIVAIWLALAIGGIVWIQR